MPADLRLTHTEDSSATVLTVAGSLDIATAAECRGFLAALLPTMAPGRTLVLDLNGLDLLAAAGLRVLLETKQACSTLGIALQVDVAPRHHISTMITRVGLAGVLSLTNRTGEALDEAVAWQDTVSFS